MTYHERKSILTLVLSTLITIGYFSYVFMVQQEGNSEVLNDLQFWGRAVLILVPVQIVLLILGHIGLAIHHRVTTGEDVPSKEDERDKLIQLKASRNSHFAFMFGFLIAMAVLAMDMGPFAMFVVLISSGILSGVVQSITELYYYRRGF
jgi:hypothetical protein